jgi:signal transduction histidine kinase
MWQTNYTPAQYKAHPLVWAFAQDNQGLLYLANNDGVLVFDGARWQLVRTPRPVRALATDANGRLFVGCVGDFGRLNAEAHGALYYQSLADNLPKKSQKKEDVLRVHATDDGVYFATAMRIIHYKESGDLFELRVLAENEGVTGTCQLNNQTGGAVYAGTASGLALVQRGALQPVPGGQALKGKTPLAVMGTGGKLRVVTVQDEVYELTGGAAQPIASPVTKYLQANQTYEAAPLRNAPLWVVATLKGGAALVNAQNEMVRYLNKQSGLPDNDVYALFVDATDGIWIAHGKGVSCLRPTLPIENITMGEISGKISDLAYHKGALYAATSQGVFMQASGAFKAVPQITTESWKLLVAQGRLLAATNDGVYEVEGARAQKVHPRTLAFNLSVSQQDARRVWVAGARGAVTLEWNGKQWVAGTATVASDVELNSACQTADGALYLGTNYQGALVQKAGSDKVDSLPGIATQLPAEVRLVPGKSQAVALVFAGSKHYAYQGGALTGDQALAAALRHGETILFNEGGKLITANDHGLALWPASADAPTPQAIGLSTLPNQRPQAAVLFGDKLYAAYYDQLYALNANATSAAAKPTPVVLRGVVAGADSVLAGGWEANAAGRYQGLGATSVVKVPAGVNSFTIAWAAPDLISPDAVQYQHYLQGSDAGFGAWSNASTATYGSLWPGTYTFKVKSRNSLGQESEPAQLQVVVAAPWYLTWFAFVFYAVAGLIVVYMVARLYAGRIENERLRLEKIVHERTKEVTAQKQQIEAQVQELAGKNTALQNTMAELQETQGQLIQAEKMASLGQLVAGVAHEVNTPLGISVTAASTLQMRTENLGELLASNQMKKSDLTQFIADAKETSLLVLRNLNRAADLVQSFKQVAVDQSSEQTRSFTLGEYIHEIITSMSPQLKKYPKVQVKQQGETGILMNTLPSALSQIVINLINNALIHAFGAEGSGNIEVRYARVGDGRVRVQVADDGKGIAAQNLPKVFDPFFTTNRSGGGSGLGLHITYNLATTALKGKIEVESVVGKGTTFTLEIPTHAA